MNASNKKKTYLLKKSQLSNTKSMIFKLIKFLEQFRIDTFLINLNQEVILKIRFDYRNYKSITFFQIVTLLLFDRRVWFPLENGSD